MYAIRSYYDGFFVTEDIVKDMKPGAVIVDISIDRGGCIETSELRTQQDSYNFV